MAERARAWLSCRQSRWQALSAARPRGLVAPRGAAPKPVRLAKLASCRRIHPFRETRWRRPDLTKP